jgi:hypothetical protein
MDNLDEYVLEEKLADQAIAEEEDIQEGKKEEETKVTLPESPASINIRFWAHGYGTQLTIRSDKVSDVLSKFQKVLQEIEKAGYKNVWDKEPIPTAETPQKEKDPICGIHGTYMIWKTGNYKQTTQYNKQGDPYAFWSCSTKNADGSYCKYKPAKEEV